MPADRGTPTIAPGPTGAQLITVRELAGLLKLHPRTCWSLAALAEAGQSDFPKPLRLAPKSVRWRLRDVLGYLDRLAGDVR